MRKEKEGKGRGGWIIVAVPSTDFCQRLYCYAVQQTLPKHRFGSLIIKQMITYCVFGRRVNVGQVGVARWVQSSSDDDDDDGYQHQQPGLAST